MHSRKAFTLVELLVVVMVLGALAAIAVPRMISGATNAKSNACDTNIDLLNTQIELYYSTTGDWPKSLTDVVGTEKEPTEYFPDGPPACPFGKEYSYNTKTHRVSPHSH